jgi:hypothetical protein
VTQQAQSTPPTAHAAPREREWFWRILAVLMLAMTGWMGWVAYQLSPTAIVLPAAYHALTQGRATQNVQSGAIKPAAQAEAPPAAAAAEPAPAAQPAPPPPPPEPKKAPVDLEKLRLADTIETPLRKKK